MGLLDSIGKAFSELNPLNLVGDVVSSGLGLISDRNNRKAQQSMNDQNIALQRETNAQNQKNFETQLQFNRDSQTQQEDFQREMFEKTNEWNSASAQRQRLEDAGLNPYMMLSGGSAGTATAQTGSSASAPGAPQLTAPQTVAPQMQLQNFGAMIDALESFSQKSVNNANAQNLRIEGQYKGLKMMSEINETLARTRDTQLAARLKEIQHFYAADMQEAQLANFNANTQAAIAQARQMSVQTAMDEVRLQYLDESERMRIGVMAHDIGLKIAQGELTKQQGITELMKQANVRADTHLKGEQADLAASQGGLARAQAKKVRQETETEYERTNQAKVKTRIDYDTADYLIDQAASNAEKAWNNRGSDGALGLFNYFDRRSEMFDNYIRGREESPYSYRLKHELKRKEKK